MLRQLSTWREKYAHRNGDALPEVIFRRDTRIRGGDGARGAGAVVSQTLPKGTKEPQHLPHPPMTKLKA
jgi:hypothetical protein